VEKIVKHTPCAIVLALGIAAILATPGLAVARISRESIVRLHAGDDLQSAIDEANPGDTLVLDAGAEFPGPITLPYKDGNDWITPLSRQHRSTDGCVRWLSGGRAGAWDRSTRP